MTNKTKAIVGIVIVATIIVFLYFYLRKKKTESTAEKMSINTTAFPLKKGSEGPEVKLIQELILEKYDKSALPAFGADGKWGDETDAAISKYLKRSSISLDYFTKVSTYIA